MYFLQQTALMQPGEEKVLNRIRTRHAVVYLNHICNVIFSLTCFNPSQSDKLN